MGVWLPEPVMPVSNDPEAMAVLADALSIALLRVFETLSPVERAVFLLCEVFQYAHAEVAGMIKKTEASTRQILHRARQRVTSARLHHPVPREEAERLISAFLQAVSQGDLPALLAVLDEDVSWYADGGGKAPASMRPVFGATAVARAVIGWTRKLGPGLTTRLAEVNGQLAVLTYLHGTLFGVLSFVIVAERIRECDWIVNPDKLNQIRTVVQH